MRSSQIVSVMPKPPAEFSPLTMTKSSAQSRRSRGRWSSTTARPERPTTSPMNRRRMLSRGPAVDRFAFRYHECERVVVRLRRNGCDFLHGEGETDGEGALGGERRERRVVIAGAIAESVAGAIECGKRHEDKIGVCRRRVGEGFAQPRGTSDERVAAPPEMEGERPAATGDAGQGSCEP